MRLVILILLLASCEGRSLSHAKEHSLEFTPPIHKQSLGVNLMTNAKLIEAGLTDLTKTATLAAYNAGVADPDEAPIMKGDHQMKDQVVEQIFNAIKSLKKQDVHSGRVVAQHVHGSPLPLLDSSLVTKYCGSVTCEDQLTMKSRAWQNRGIDAWATMKNSQLVSAMILQASQWLCSAMPSQNAAHAWRSFGWLMHMIGDSFSASHVQRKKVLIAPLSVDPDTCANLVPMRWMFSMDTMNWVAHGLADIDTASASYKCAEAHALHLAKLYNDGRTELASTNDLLEIVQKTRVHVGNILKHICGKILNHDPSMKNWDNLPAGGASKRFSNFATILGKTKVVPLGPKTCALPDFLTDIRIDLRRRFLSQYPADQEGFYYVPENHGNYCDEIIRGDSGDGKPWQCPAIEVSARVESDTSVDGWNEDGIFDWFSVGWNTPIGQRLFFYRKDLRDYLKRGRISTDKSVKATYKKNVRKLEELIKSVMAARYRGTTFPIPISLKELNAFTWTPDSDEDSKTHSTVETYKDSDEETHSTAEPYKDSDEESHSSVEP